MADTWGLLRDERLRLAAAIEGSSAEQWAAQSQCEDWTVRDVLAHVVMTPDLRPPRVLPAMLRHRFNVPRLLSALAREDEHTPAQLIQKLRDIADERHTPPKARAENVLADIVLHARDIFRPLGSRYQSQKEAQLVAAELLVASDFNCASAKRARGLRLVADDVDWSHGDGPEIRGPLHALLEGIGGRRAALVDLTGDGKPLLADRCPTSVRGLQPAAA